MVVLLSVGSCCCLRVVGDCLQSFLHLSSQAYSYSLKNAEAAFCHGNQLLCNVVVTIVIVFIHTVPIRDFLLRSF